MVKISPSILAADFALLGQQVKELEKNEADFIHIDVMDGNFVPNISFGVPVMKSIKKLTKVPFDVHLMIDNPSRYIDDFINAGADILTIHYEADRHIDRTINYIRSKGIKAAVALNPGTPICMIKDLLPYLDMVLIMSVNPGFGGQKFIDYSYDKIREIKSLSMNVNKDLMIEVDGGVDKSNIKKLMEAGANVFVAGSSIFKDNEIEKNIKELKEAVK